MSTGSKDGEEHKTKQQQTRNKEIVVQGQRMLRWLA
jgi:hypothetical protein